ncbi:hypothetical protein RB599_010300 [Gaeumannomyces hyphopodioides]
MDLQAYKAEIVKFRATNVTKTVHATSYPAISPLRPELSQAGRTVLITGGGSGCGLNVAKSFVAAKAARVVIVGRRIDTLAAAQKELEEEAAKLSSPSVILHRQCDVAVDADVEKVWVDAEIGPVHVLVLSAASFQKDPKSLVDFGYKNLWPLFETNVKGNLHMTEVCQTNHSRRAVSWSQVPRQRFERVHPHARPGPLRLRHVGPRLRPD